MRLSHRLSLLGEQPAPDELRRRILDALDREDRAADGPITAGRIAGIGGLAVAAALAGLIFTGPRRHTDPDSAITSAVAPAGLPTLGQIESGDASHIRRWLESQVGYSVEVPDITDARLTGARIVSTDGSAAAAVTYTLHGQPLTYLALPGARVLGRLVSHESVETMSVDGYNVATWTEKGAARAVMAPISRREVAAVARECKRKATL